MMILTGKLFKFRYVLGGSVQPPVVVYAESMDAADAEVLLHAAAQPGYDGENVRVLSATEIDLSGL